MSNLFQWEFHSFIKGKKLLSFIIAALILAAVYVGIAIYTEVPNGITGVAESAAFMSSLLVFICPVVAGLMIAQAFESRLIQASVMSGKSRFAVVVVKTLCFILLMFILMLLTTTLSSLGITLAKGWGEIDLGGISAAQYICSIIMFLALSVVGYSIVVPLAFYTKKIGSSIGLGFALSLAVYMLIEQMVKNENSHALLQYTPSGRSFFVLNDQSAGYWLGSFIVLVAWIFIYIGISYALIKNEELK
ncbi:MAG: hypothetical protein Q4E09_04445 [Eubacteriales bacterium]|nr:hypothetical protein [Eubacteriales bacterium]